MFAILTNLYFRIPKVAQQRYQGVVESITCVGNSIRVPAMKKCENLLRFDKVTADYKAVQFFPDMVYIKCL